MGIRASTAWIEIGVGVNLDILSDQNLVAFQISKSRSVKLGRNPLFLRGSKSIKIELSEDTRVFVRCLSSRQ
jgi:hypothetical protein